MEGKVFSANLHTKHENKLFFFFSQPEKAPIFTIYKGNITPIAARSNIICLNKSIGLKNSVLVYWDKHSSPTKWRCNVDSSVHVNISAVRSGEFSQL